MTNEQRDVELARAEQLKREASETLKRWLTERVGADDLIAMGRQLDEAMTIYYACGLVGEVVGDRLRALELSQSEFEGVARRSGTYEIPADGKWRIVNDRLFANAYCVGTTQEVEERSDGSVRVVYEPRCI
jgi:hypothetical protein